MRQQKSAPTPVPSPSSPRGRHPALASANRRVVRALALLTVAVLAWVGWSLWRGDGLAAARAALDRRDFGTAYELIAGRLAALPDDDAAQLLAAQAARRGGNPARAAEHLRKYRALRGDDATHAAAARLLRVQNGDLAEAETLFTDAIDRSDAESALALEAYLEGKLKALARSGDPREAVEAQAGNLRRAIVRWRALRPGREDQVQGLLWLAILSERVKDHTAGVAALREILTLDPDHFGARFLLAKVLAQEKPEETREHLEYLRGKYPDNLSVRYGLAASYRVTGRTADARALFEQLLGGPHDLSASVELASMDLDAGKVADAERRLRVVVERAPNSPEVHLELSRCHRLAGRLDEAEKSRKKYEELDAARAKK